MINSITTLIFDRSDPNQIVAVYPKGHEEYPEGRKVTRAEDLKKGSYYYGRRDLCMVNLNYADGSHEQLVAEPDARGNMDWTNTGKYFTADERARVDAIAARIYELATTTNPEFKKLLGSLI